MSLLVCQYKIQFRLLWLSELHSYVFILFLCLVFRTKCINLSHESLDVSSITSNLFPNLFLKICALFGKILITCLKCSRVSFSLSTYNDKMHWGQGWTNSKVLVSNLPIAFKKFLPKNTQIRYSWSKIPQTGVLGSKFRHFCFFTKFCN